MGYKRELEQPVFPQVSSKEPRLPAEEDATLEFDISYSDNSFSSFMKLFDVDPYDDEGDEADSSNTPLKTPPEFYTSSESSRSVVISPCPSVHIRFPRKPVPVGPEHQADLPDPIPLAAYLARTADGSAQGGLVWRPTGGEPFPEARRVTCDCFDLGSIPCTRQHVGEARREVEDELGYPVFTLLGLAEMGETVAEQWSREEEAEFYNIVCTNPRSSRRRFWPVLREAFPRTRAELVSYYFNVFMLRRRAVQNQMGPLYVDSDDDGPPMDLDCPFCEDDDDDDDDDGGEEEGMEEGDGPQLGLYGPELGLYGPELGLYGPGVKNKAGCGLGLKEECWGECSGSQKVELPAWSVVEGLLE